jgi:hypothetical protein
MKQKLTWPFLRAEGGRLCWSQTLGAAKNSFIACHRMTGKEKSDESF